MGIRDIIFRGKRVDNGEWVYGNLNYGTIEIENIQDTYFISDFDVNPWDKKFYKVIPESVGQYTGLTDKNGKKIFEGDIVNWGSREWGGPYKELVKWSYELFDMRTHDWHEWCEVIGNPELFGNPELLEVKV